MSTVLDGSIAQLSCRKAGRFCLCVMCQQSRSLADGFDSQTGYNVQKVVTREEVTLSCGVVIDVRLEQVANKIAGREREATARKVQ